jgi:hypothetical protein
VRVLVQHLAAVLLDLAQTLLSSSAETEKERKKEAPAFCSSCRQS